MASIIAVVHNRSVSASISVRNKEEAIFNPDKYDYWKLGIKDDNPAKSDLIHKWTSLG